MQSYFTLSVKKVQFSTKKTMKLKWSPLGLMYLYQPTTGIHSLVSFWLCWLFNLRIILKNCRAIGQENHGTCRIFKHKLKIGNHKNESCHFDGFDCVVVAHIPSFYSLWCSCRKWVFDKIPFSSIASMGTCWKSYLVILLSYYQHLIEAVPTKIGLLEVCVSN